MEEDQIEVEVVYSEELPDIPFYIVKPYIPLVNKRFKNSSNYTTDIPDKKLEEILEIFDDVAEMIGFYSGLEINYLINRINQKRNKDINEKKQKLEIESDIRYSLGLHIRLRKHSINTLRIISSETFTQLETTETSKYYLGSTMFMGEEIIFPQFIPIIYNPTHSETFQRSSQTSLGQIHSSLPKNTTKANFRLK